jgi:hypothetical protein
MNDYVQFDGYYTEHVRGGVSVGTVGMVSTLGNGTTVSIPTPFIRIGGNLGIIPAIDPDGDASLRIDFTRWSPVRYGQDLTAGFPFNFPSQDLAVKVARAFDADPRTTWRDAPDAIGAWLRTWGADNGLNFGSPGGAR